MLDVLDARPYTLLMKIQGMFENSCCFYLETSNFELAQKCSFHATEELSMARNAKLYPMLTLLEGVTVH